MAACMAWVLLQRELGIAFVQTQRTSCNGSISLMLSPHPDTNFRCYRKKNSPACQFVVSNALCVAESYQVCSAGL